MMSSDLPAALTTATSSSRHRVVDSIYCRIPKSAVQNYFGDATLPATDLYGDISIGFFPESSESSHKSVDSGSESPDPNRFATEAPTTPLIKASSYVYLHGVGSSRTCARSEALLSALLKEKDRNMEDEIHNVKNPPAQKVQEIFCFSRFDCRGHGESAERADVSGNPGGDKYDFDLFRFSCAVEDQVAALNRIEREIALWAGRQTLTVKASLSEETHQGPPPTRFGQYSSPSQQRVGSDSESRINNCLQNSQLLSSSGGECRVEVTHFLVGHSMGGVVAAQICRLRERLHLPFSVAGLAVLCPGFGIAGMMEDVVDAGEPTGSVKIRHRHADKRDITLTFGPNFASDQRANFGLSPEEFGKEVVQALTNARILALHGQQDEWLDWRNTERFAVGAASKAPPQSVKWLPLENVGHELEGVEEQVAETVQQWFHRFR